MPGWHLLPRSIPRAGPRHCPGPLSRFLPKLQPFPSQPLRRVRPRLRPAAAGAPARGRSPVHGKRPFAPRPNKSEIPMEIEEDRRADNELTRSDSPDALARTPPPALVPVTARAANAPATLSRTPSLPALLVSLQRRKFLAAFLALTLGPLAAVVAWHVIPAP